MQSSDTPAVTIRPAVPADRAALGKLGALLMRMHHDFDPQRFIAPEPGTEQGYGAFLKSPLEDQDVIILVAQRDGEVIGYAYAAVEGSRTGAPRAGGRAARPGD